MKNTELNGVIAEHIAAVNAFDLDAIMETFADDAYVNDARREFVGAAAVRRWVEREMVGDHVTIDVTEVLEHHGDTVVRGVYDGTFDRSKLPRTDGLLVGSGDPARSGEAGPGGLEGDAGVR
jgi:ketosteroid isomerase-like protein